MDDNFQSSLRLISYAPVKKSIMMKTYGIIFRHILANLKHLKEKRYNKSVDTATWDMIMNTPDEELLKLKGFGPKCLECIHTIREFYNPYATIDHTLMTPFRNSVEYFENLGLVNLK